MANSLELAEQIVSNGFLPPSHPNYSLTTPTQLFKELNDCLTMNFERAVTNVRSGYWLRPAIVPCVAGTSRYRIPPRAVMGGVERVELAQSTAHSYLPLEEVAGTEAAGYELAGTGTGTPSRFECRGDTLTMLPTPNGAYSLRVWYYARPSRLVYAQSPTLVSDVLIVATDRGRITSIAAIGTRQITVNVLPFRMHQTTPAAIVTGVDRIDIVHPTGSCELALIDATQTLSGTVITIGGSDPLDQVQVGDYVRAADETDWPPLPLDFHRLLADLATVSVLTQLHLLEKASAYARKIEGDMQRFRDLLQPRVRNQLRGIPFPDHVFGGGSMGGGFRGGFP